MKYIKENWNSEELSLLRLAIGQTLLCVGTEDEKTYEPRHLVPGRLIFKTDGGMLGLDRGDYEYDDYFGTGPDEVYGFSLVGISAENQEGKIFAPLPDAYRYRNIKEKIMDALLLEDRGTLFIGELPHTEFSVRTGLILKLESRTIMAYGSNPRDIWIEISDGEIARTDVKDLEEEWGNMVNKGGRIEVTRYLRSLKSGTETELASVSMEGTFDPSEYQN